MKKIWILVVVLVIVVGAGYLGRHTIKALFGGSSQSSIQPQPQTTSQTNAAPSDNIYLIKTNPAKGKYLTDFAGMTLYSFDKDTKGVSNCDNTCATTWKPYTSGATAQAQFPVNISVITRADKSTQFAWKGMPLYYYSGDQKTGDVTGDGVGGVWHLVKP